MRQAIPRRIGILGAALAMLAMLGAGPAKPKAGTTLKVEETVADLADIQANGGIPVEGVGLVVGLEGTGSDPAPGAYRTKLENEMNKARVPSPAKILADPSTSLVLVKAVIPTGVTPRDPFDVEVALPPGSTTTSLAGGRLIRTWLSVVAVTDGGTLDGQVMAAAIGPVLTGSANDPDDLKSGRILGGGRVKKDVPFVVVLKENRKGVIAAKYIEDAIQARFFYLDGVKPKGMATAKSDQHLELKVPIVYRQNQYRYFQVVNRLPILTNDALRGARQERWAKELLDPRTAGEAALRLEGIGRNAIPSLKAGLASPDGQVRYFAAEALAYLNDGAGVDVLKEAAISRPEFRAHALAAMSAMDHEAALSRLRDLMGHPDVSLRYGAFNALRTLAPDDVYLGRARVLRPEPPPEGLDEDEMALAIKDTPRRTEPFELYLVDCDGPPLVHVSRSRRQEVVVFGKDVKLLTPVVLGGSGSILMNAADGDSRVQISRIGPGDDDLKVACPLNLGEVVRELAALKAAYPEILALLEAAAKQRNLPGPLVVDAMPVAVPAYDQAQLAGARTDPKAKKDAAVSRTKLDTPAPRRGLFGRLRDRSGKR